MTIQPNITEHRCKIAYGCKTYQSSGTQNSIYDRTLIGSRTLRVFFLILPIPCKVPLSPLVPSVCFFVDRLRLLIAQKLCKQPVCVSWHQNSDNCILYAQAQWLSVKKCYTLCTKNQPMRLWSVSHGAIPWFIVLLCCSLVSCAVSPLEECLHCMH